MNWYASKLPTAIRLPLFAVFTTFTAMRIVDIHQEIFNLFKIFNKLETNNVHYTISYNRNRKTYTIREYDQQGKQIAKYRSYPQGDSYSENWTQEDIRNFLKSDEYYKI